MKVRSLLPFRLGTVARPSTPTGRRALFYKGKDGHRLISPVQYIKQKVFRLRPPAQIALLAPPRTYHEFLCTVDGITPGELGSVGSAPAAFRKVVFEEYEELFQKMIDNSARQFCWDKNGIHMLTLKREEKTRTVFLEPQTLIAGI